MSKKVLLVDDDPDFINIMSMYLAGKNFNIITASGGEEGFSKATKENPDVIVLDVMMKYVTEGLDVAKRLKQHSGTKNIPLILVTGMNKRMSLPFKLEADKEFLPVEKVLEKPVKPEKLLNTINESLGF